MVKRMIQQKNMVSLPFCPPSNFSTSLTKVNGRPTSTTFLKSRMMIGKKIPKYLVLVLEHSSHKHQRLPPQAVISPRQDFNLKTNQIITVKTLILYEPPC